MTLLSLRPIFVAVVTAMLLFSLGARAGDADAFIAAGLEAELRQDPVTALENFRRADAARPDDAFIKQKIAQQLSDSAFLLQDESVQKQLTAEALQYAHRAVELAPDSAINRLSLAVLYGKVAVFSGVRTKVDHARRIHQHAEEALALDPDYAWAAHVLGRWHVEMAALGATRRTLAAVFFGGLPAASIDEGVRLLERAVALEPAGLAHQVELGFAYAQAGRRDDAETQWRLAVSMPSVKIYDEPAKQRARTALGNEG
jgi:tetratricopeptide (TPR) repeat protein